jgi:nucleotide-binding universal stress UspA family protein
METSAQPAFSPRRVVVPVDALSEDGLAFGRRALEVATSLVKPAGGTVLLLTALAPPFPFAGIDVSRELEETVRAAEAAKAARSKEMLDSLAAIPRAAGVAVESLLLAEVGGDAARIVEAAKREQADLIVLTSHHRKGLERFFMGSVAERVAHLSTIPVLLLPPAA